MKIMLLAGIFAIGFSRNAVAKLGETLEQISARYGNEVQEPEQEGGLYSHYYHFQSNLVCVGFLNGKSAMEMIRPLKEEKKLSDEECLILGAAVAEKTNWVEAQDFDVQYRRWTSGDFQLYKKNGFGSWETLVISGKELSDFFEAQGKKHLDDLAASFGGKVGVKTNQPGDSDWEYRMNLEHAQHAAAIEAEQKKKSDIEAAAFKFYQDKASSGDDDGQYHLGLIYRDGRGIAKDLAKARDLLQKSADQGNKDAAAALAKLTPP